jgi:hypothetical protein
MRLTVLGLVGREVFVSEKGVGRDAGWPWLAARGLLDTLGGQRMWCGAQGAREYTFKHALVRPYSRHDEDDKQPCPWPCLLARLDYLTAAPSTRPVARSHKACGSGSLPKIDVA